MDDSNEDSPQKSRLRSDLLRFCLVGLLFLGLAVLIREGLTHDTQLWLSNLRLLLQGSELDYGIWGSSALFVLMAATSITLGVPRLWISGFAGAIYGAVLGMTLALVAATIGAATVYLIGQHLLGNVVKRRFQGQRSLWRSRFQQNAFWWVLYARLFPFSNATMTSLLCGSCQVPFNRYLGASIIGFMPLTFVFATFGSGGAKGNINQIILGFGLLVGALVVRLLLKKIRPGRNPPNASWSKTKKIS